MKNFIKTILIILMVGVPSLYGHGSAKHEHRTQLAVDKEVSKKSIKDIAKQEIKRLTLAKKIDDSWLFTPISKMKKIQFNNAPEWVVSFNNPKIKDIAKQTVYVFISVNGKVLAANYTGK